MVALDFSGKPGKPLGPATLTASVERLRPHTLVPTATSSPPRRPTRASSSHWHNPLAERAPLHGRRRLPRPIREQQEQRALDAAIASTPQPHRLIFRLLRETGMRVREVLALRWGDVIPDAGREALRIREAKNGLERTVILGATATPRTLRGLRAARRALGRMPADHDILFRSNRGTRVSYDALHYQWAKLCHRAGLVDTDGGPRDTPHQLRHTRGSELIQQGQRVEIVQRVLGHCDIRSTLGYADLQEAQLRAPLGGSVPRG